MHKRILILNDGSDYENWGIKACIDGLKAVLESKQMPGVELSSLSHSFMHKHYSFEPKIFGKKIFAKNGRFARKILKEFHLLPKETDEFEHVAELWLKDRGGRGVKEFIEKAKNVDAVIFNGEGSTYRTNVAAVKGLFMLWFAKTKLGKKALFMNGSVTLTRVDAILPAMVNKVFSAIDLAYVREPYSYRNILEYYPDLEHKVKMFPDSAFILDIPESDKLPDLEFVNRDFFVFSLSMLTMYSGSRDRSAMVEVISKLKSIVPNAVLIAKDSEDQILRDVARETNSFFVGPEFSYSQIMQILGKAKFIFSGRYHHLIFASRVGCPGIPMASSSHKIHGLSELFGDLMIEPIDPTSLRSKGEKIVLAARKIIEGGNAIRDAYSKKAEQLKEKSLAQASLVSEILNK